MLELTGESNDCHIFEKLSHGIVWPSVASEVEMEILGASYRSVHFNSI